MRASLARWAVASCLVLSTACGGDDETPQGSSDAGNRDARDAPIVTCPFELSLLFGRNGMVTVPGLIGRRGGCLMGTKLDYARWEQFEPRAPLNSLICWWQPAPCDASTALAAVRLSVDDPEVAAALIQEPRAVYGLDQRTVDDGMYTVRSGIDCSRLSPALQMPEGGRGFDLGVPCTPGTDRCHPIPPAIALFVERLEALEREARKGPGCF
jgi:hypothetical protein